MLGRFCTHLLIRPSFLGLSSLEGLGFDVEYLAFVDESTMCEVDHGGTGKRVIVAANFAGVRLIDNVPSEG